jgi:hypothetical protein
MPLRLVAWMRAALTLTAAVAYLFGFAPLYSAWGRVWWRCRPCR